MFIMRQTRKDLVSIFVLVEAKLSYENGIIVFRFLYKMSV